MSKPVIRFLLVYARSGGTLLNKCLEALPNVKVLSEVSPFGGGMGKEKDPFLATIEGQASKWFGYDLKSKNYVDKILELNQYCEKKGVTLVIRDWSYIYFNKNKKNNFTLYNNLMGLNLLREVALIKSIAFTRNAIDCYISFKSPLAMQIRFNPSPKINEFAVPYLNFANSIKSTGIEKYKYEDFTQSPYLTLKRICDSLDIDYEENALKKFYYQNANGDTHLNGLGSRGGQLKKITTLTRKPILPFEIMKIMKNKYLYEANKLLMYNDHSYFNDDFSTKNYMRDMFIKVSNKILT